MTSSSRVAGSRRTDTTPETFPILVTGSHRSGTTWAGRMLALSGEVCYVHEPFNPDRRPGWSGGRIPYWFMYIHPGIEHQFIPVMENVLAYRYPIRDNLPEIRGPRQAALFARDVVTGMRYRMRPQRALLKDPIALFSAEWLAARFGAQVVVMIRHPSAFVSSIKRLNWSFSFAPWLVQPDLLRDWLGDYEDQMKASAFEKVDIIDQAILMWNCLHHVIDAYRAKHDDWSFVRHEDLSADPNPGFRALYDKLGLTWSRDVEHGIARFTGSGNPREVAAWRHGSVKRDSREVRDVWRHRLTPEESDRVIAGTRQIARRFYSDDELAL